ncbi:methylenetetrahydrofolate reductase 1-like [Drosophila innubila]|uniref:methylenetetrahydrofolate reductase 1-like n=1 Tax=Drosophila innubila TaxID=198719 RepID=UPI00148BAE5D|nr:methylenetetrahydrofolate reductase 1-like [Drosophila innubila]
MHTLDLGTGNTSLRPISDLPEAVQPCFSFTKSQLELSLTDPNIADLVANKTASKEFFYGIEIMAHNEGKITCVDFNLFLPLLPTFVSIVWSRQFSESIRSSTMKQVASMQLIPYLNSHISAMPHLSLYRLSEKLLDEFLALNFTNVLVVRGDQTHDDQEYKYAYQVVEYLRRARGDKISIAVGGYPEGYTSLTTEPQDKVQNIRFLKRKVDAGANFIISQLCYSGDKIVEFIRDARSGGITVPILIGMVVPDSFGKYENLEKITGVRLPPEERDELEKIQYDNNKVKDFFVQLTVRNIQHVMDVGLGIYGIQFFTLNRFESVLDVLRELRTRNILKEPSTGNSVEA